MSTGFFSQGSSRPGPPGGTQSPDVEGRRSKRTNPTLPISSFTHIKTSLVAFVGEIQQELKSVQHPVTLQPLEPGLPAPLSEFSGTMGCSALVLVEESPSLSWPRLF